MNPHVSDEQIEKAAFARVPTPNGLDPMDDDDNDVIEGHKADRYWISYGMKECRDLYEPLVTSQKERIAALEEALGDGAKSIHHHLAQASRIADSSRVWGGMKWSYYPLPTVKCNQVVRHLTKALEIVIAARDLLTPKTTDPK
jgi:hypothetical protein